MKTDHQRYFLTTFKKDIRFYHMSDVGMLSGEAKKIVLEFSDSLFICDFF